MLIRFGCRAVLPVRSSYFFSIFLNPSENVRATASHTRKIEVFDFTVFDELLEFTKCENVIRSTKST
ncbi:BTB/POZ domain-containing protein [Bacillus pumilus]|uniref:BTB/POZ domain-containing protein n=1 Tax=Bacillus TaxID=1386 RepID=UPI001644BEAA|nr:BTB/POZ domain-containing protein [Bacillus pumilus]